MSLERFRRGEPVGSLFLYRSCRTLGRGLVRLLARIRTEGVEHIPLSGPCVLVANHQSALDPILVQTHCPRPVHTLTKSTQFGHFPFNWLLPRILAIPVRRYQVDPQVVRVALRRLAHGEIVGVYPEGERTWDGALQPLRRGTVRLLLRAGVPVVPCGLSGALHLWPRWASRPRRGEVVIRFGRPLDLGGYPDRESREAALPEAMERLRKALESLSPDTTEGEGWGEWDGLLPGSPPEGRVMEGRGVG